MNCMEPSDDHEFDEVAERYEASEDFVTDAIDYVSESPCLPDELVALAREHYAASSKFATKVHDALAGEVVFS